MVAIAMLVKYGILLLLNVRLSAVLLLFSSILTLDPVIFVTLFIRLPSLVLVHLVVALLILLAMLIAQELPVPVRHLTLGVVLIVQELLAVTLALVLLLEVEDALNVQVQAIMAWEHLTVWTTLNVDANQVSHGKALRLAVVVSVVSDISLIVLAIVNLVLRKQQPQLSTQKLVHAQTTMSLKLHLLMLHNVLVAQQ